MLTEKSLASNQFSWNKVWKKDHRLNYYEWPAYLIDIYRIAPRALLAAATWYVYHIGEWYIHLPTAERTTEVSVFAGLVFAAWTKACDWYMQRGVDWSKRMMINGGEQGNVAPDTTVS